LKYLHTKGNVVRERESRDSREPRDSRDSRNSRMLKKRTCRFCSSAEQPTVTYKDAEVLRAFMTEKGKILPRRNSGCCAKHQRRLAVVIKKSRHVGLVPFQAE
jgi:small subunit ribosomal protein S18